jgi:hypothetical protein
VEAIEYLNLKHIELENGKLKRSDNTIFTQDALSKYLDNKQPEFFCLKCYETNVFSLIPMEEQLFRIERKLKDIEKLLKRVNILKNLLSDPLTMIIYQLILLISCYQSSKFGFLLKIGRFHFQLSLLY